MKLYFNERTYQFYKEGELMNKRFEDGSRFFGIPTKEQLKEWGYIDYSPQGRLQNAKEKKIAKLVTYDQSSAVNEFTFNGIPMWLDKATRDGLHLRFLAEQAAGKENTTLWFGTMSFEIPISNVFQLLYAIEVYASACYDRTAAHKAAIEALTSIEDVDGYDFTTGYPEKLNF